MNSPWQNTLSELIDAMPFGVMILDGGHRIQMGNRAVASVLNTTPEKMKGKICCALVHGSPTPIPDCPLEETLVTETPTTRDLRDDRSGRWTSCTVFPLPFESGSGGPLYMHLTRDVTEEKDHLQLLSRSLENDRAINAVLQRTQSCLTAREIIEAVIEEVLNVSWMGLSTSACGFLVRDGALDLAVERNLHPALQRLCGRVPLGQCLCGQAALTGEPIVHAHVGEDHTTSYDGMQDHGHVALPLLSSGRMLGVLNFYLPPGKVIDDRSSRFLQTVASLCATAIAHLDDLVQAQRDALSELEAPVMPISDEVLTLPLVGTIDSRRADLIMRRLLEAANAHNPRFVIIDITGVSSVDTSVANVLIGAANAVELLGVRTIFTGIQPRLARTFVQLRTDLERFPTFSTLQRGIAFAMKNAES